MERRRLVNNQIQQIEGARRERLEQAPSDGLHAMVRLLGRVIGSPGPETANMLVQEVLSRNMRDRRAVSALCRPHWLARREREEMPGERAGPFGQCSGSTRHDLIGVAVAHVPEEQRLGAVVSSPHR